YDIIGLTFFSKVWKQNLHFQYEIIKHCIVSNWVGKILNGCTNENLKKIVPQVENLKCPLEYETDFQISCWKYQCLSQILLDLSDNQLIYPYLEEIFFLPLNKCPDLLVFALLECQGNNMLKEVVLVKALVKFICVSPNNPNPNATIIIQRIWPSDYIYTTKSSLSVGQKSLLTAMVELYTSSSPEEQSYKLTKILDLSQDLKILNVLLSSNTYLFVIDLACFASRREYLKLDKWLDDKINKIGLSFVKSCIQFLERRCSIFGATDVTTVLPNETYRTILACLRQHVSDSPKNIWEFEIIKMYNKFNQFLSQNQFVNNQMSVHIQTPVKPSQFDAAGSHFQDSNRGSQINNFVEVEQEFSKEIEEEADSYFQRIYNQDQPDTLTIDQFLEMLKQFQESTSKREKDIAACMIRNLFKEYPFLAQYPDKELVITGEIFGGIIMNNFVKGFHMVTALRCVLDALKRPASARYITFGQAALNKMKTRLKEFPQFCNHLCSVSIYRDLPQNLIEYIEYGKQSMDPPCQQKQRVSNHKMISNTSNNLNNSSGSSDNRFTGQNQQTQAEITPPSNFQDKVAFIINNLSQLNLAKKAEEFRELFIKEKDLYYVWFSQYFVSKRVSLEANFHELYCTFIFKLSINDLSSKILWETYRNIKILLRTNKETDNFNDRTLLKNLGNWLGMITLAQNKPILSDNLDLRNLLIEAYHKGLQQLQYVIPFVTRVLLGCGKSKVFRPPCPWTVKLLKILGELHAEPDLKLNLKFEVEVLCKNIDIDLHQYLGKSHELKNKELFLKLEPQLTTNLPMSINSKSDSVTSMDATNLSVLKQQSRSQQSPSFKNNTIISTQLSALAVPSNINTTSAIDYNEMNINAISNLSQSIVIQPNLQVIILNPNLQTFIKSVIDKCVQEWINFILERVIRVCLVATESLIKKDFESEPNADLMRNAAHKMMKCLVSGFSLINTEEPLLNRLQMHLQNFFQSKQIANVSKDIIDSTVTTLINDNLELCVCFVQKICIERGLEELDKKLKPEYEMRQNVKQLQIYEEMGRNIAGFNSAAFVAATSNVTGSGIAGNNSSSAAVFYNQIDNSKNISAPIAAPVMANHNNVSYQGPTGPMHPVEQPAQIDSFVYIYDKLMKHLNELIQEFEYVHYTTEAMQQVMEVLKLAKQQPRDQATATSLIKNVLNGIRELIFHTESNVTDFAVISRARDFYLLLLKALSDQRAFNLRFTTTNITRFIIEYWISVNSSFPEDLFDTINRADLINFNFMDTEFYQFLENGTNSVAINIILSFLKCYLPTININHFQSTLELLQRILMKVNQANPLVNDLKNVLNLARLNVTNANSNEITETPQLNDKFELIIKEWINCYNSPKNINNSFSIIVKNMNSQGLLKNDDLISRFFKCFLEFCVERCYQVYSFASIQNFAMNDVRIKYFEYIDAFAALVLMFIKQSGNQGNVDQKFQFLSRILAILANTAHRDQEIRNKDFQPIAYFRILVNIFIEFFYSPFNLGIQDMFINNENLFEVFKWHIVRTYCSVLRLISPLKTPSFSFAWLNFISHRIFIGKCLDNIPQINYKTWHVYYLLLNDLLTFFKPLLQNFETLVVSSTHLELYKVRIIIHSSFLKFNSNFEMR
ncbi:CCR4-NOT transcription complex subunit 1-like protein 1, partial [Sarcoptes scabiei]